jgi:hypothetical protein
MTVEQMVESFIADFEKDRAATRYFREMEGWPMENSVCGMAVFVRAPVIE